MRECWYRRRVSSPNEVDQEQYLALKLRCAYKQTWIEAWSKGTNGAMRHATLPHGSPSIIGSSARGRPVTVKDICEDSRTQCHGQTIPAFTDR
jgi:hypothetical protein